MSKFRNFEKYEIYEDGRIFSYWTNKWLKPITRKDGYQQVNLYDNDGKIKCYLLHRVVWEAVTGSPIPEGYEINHRSEVKTSNMITNLELVSHKQNLNYGSGNERRSKSLTNNPKISKQVGAFKNNELIFTFPSTSEAQRQGFDSGNVSKCCNGKQKTYKCYTWKYL